MEKTNYSFSGWVTRNNLLCADGRVIAENAFAQELGKKNRVPLVYNHDHKDINNVIGFVDLVNKKDGVYGYASLNDTPNGEIAKKIINHGDVDSLSIFANGLKHAGNKVTHGKIREVSLVLAGANPGACIDSISISHGEDREDEGIIYTGMHGSVLIHSEGDSLYDPDLEEDSYNKSEENELTDDEILHSMNDSQKELYYISLALASEGDLDLSHSGLSDTDSILDSMDVNQKELFYRSITEASELSHSEENGSGEEVVEHSEKGGEKTMDKNFNVEEALSHYDDNQQEEIAGIVGAAVEAAKEDWEKEKENGGEAMRHSAFEGSNESIYGDMLIHSEEIAEAIKAGKDKGSMKAAFVEAGIGDIRVTKDYIAHGVDNIDYLFPDAKNLTSEPRFIDIHPKEWVSKVLSGVHHTPFSKVKMMFADITQDEARAKGYLKGNVKTDEVFSLIKRTVSATTIYKKQSIDKDDELDITDINVIAWIKKEMRIKLDEEIARAIVFGDGRLASDNDKIKEDCIIPIIKDTSANGFYAYVQEVSVPEGGSVGEAIIDATVKAMEKYEGSGNTTALLRQDKVTDIILHKDTLGHRMYKTLAEAAAAMTVNSIVKWPASVCKDPTVLGVIVDLYDYNVGADKGGSVNLYDDFDIDFNKEKFLIETRCSGALTAYHSAIILKLAD